MPIKWMPAAAMFLLIVAQANAGVAGALEWLSLSQNADGSWGGADCWQPVCTPFAAMALNQTANFSSNVSHALAWMKADLQDAESWSWAEADIPGAELLAVASSENYSDLNLSNVSARLLEMQDNETGGFRGWWTENGTIADSVDTAFAVIGLTASSSINETDAGAAANFLLSLQNPDGSFNHSGGLAEASLGSLGADFASTTALALAAFNSTSGNASNESIESALEFLRHEANTCFGNANRSYSAALAALAFNAYGDIAYAQAAVAYLESLQRTDGGFRDARRTGNSSNALDTGAAALALQAVALGQYPCHPLQNPPSMEVNGSMQANDILEIAIRADELAAGAGITVIKPDGSNESFEAANASNHSFKANYTPPQAGGYTLLAKVRYPAFDFETNRTLEITAQPAPSPTPTPPPQQSSGGNYVTSGYVFPAGTPTPTETTAPAATHPPSPAPTAVFKTVEDTGQRLPQEKNASPTRSPATTAKPAEEPTAGVGTVTGLVASRTDFVAGAAAAAAVLITLAYYFTAKRKSA